MKIKNKKNNFKISNNMKDLSQAIGSFNGYSFVVTLKDNNEIKKLELFKDGASKINVPEKDILELKDKINSWTDDTELQE